MVLVFRSLGDPAPQQFFLRGRESLMRLGRWHEIVRILREDALDQLALAWFAGDDGLFGDRLFAHVQAEFALALVGVRPVTIEAVFGKNRPDVAIIAELRLGSGRSRGGRSGKSRPGMSRDRQGHCSRYKRLTPFHRPRQRADRLTTNSLSHAGLS